MPLGHQGRIQEFDPPPPKKKGGGGRALCVWGRPRPPEALGLYMLSLYALFTFFIAHVGTFLCLILASFS